MPITIPGVKHLLAVVLLLFSINTLADQWVALGSGVAGGDVKAIAVDKNSGVVYVGGTFTSAGGVANTTYIAKWDGTNWSSLGTGMNGAVKALAVDAAGNLYAGGSFTSADGVANTAYIAKWNGSAWSALATGMNNAVNVLAVDASGKLYAGGDFSTAGGVAATGIAKWDGSGWSALATSPASNVSSMTIDSNNNVYVGNVYSGGHPGYVAKWDGVSWNTLPYITCRNWSYPGGGPGTQWCTDSIVQALGADNKGNIYAANVDTLAKYPQGTLSGYNCSLMKWSGSSWISIKSMTSACGSLPAMNALLIDTAAAVYVGGRNIFYSSYSLLKFVGTTQNTVGGGFGTDSPNIVKALATYNDSNVYVGGNFVTANGLTVNGIALWHQTDTDNDGVPDINDNCPTVVNANQLDTDHDGIGDTCDPDIDGDGVLNASDAFPLNPAEWADNDNDGIGNNADPDDDNDLMPDTWEITYGLNSLVNDANGDADSDGYTNLQEYITGTNPQDASSHIYVSRKNDYNADNIAGWLWKGDSNGVETHSEIWQLTFPLYSDNWGIPARSYPPIFADQANWEIQTTGDFNKDGDADILWRNLTTDDWKIWQMQNGLRVGQTNWVDTFDPTHQWSVIGAGDTDKDGDDDIILNNASTGEVMIWEVQNHAVIATHLLSTTKPGYIVNRIGDFNKDGDVDLMLSEVGGSNLVIWEIENNAFVLEHTFPTNATGWDLKCAGDFDHDGDDDILLINSSTQQEKWFEIENYARIAQHVGATNTGFVLLGCGDYDGDGDMDMLWQRSADDMNRIVLQQNWGVTKQTVYTNPYGGVNPGAAGYGYVYRGNNN